MDLYEALKAGASTEELLKAFHKDLDAASARIAAEEHEAAAKEALLTDARESLAEATLDYVKALLGEELGESCSLDSIVEALKEFEKEIEQVTDLSNELNKILKKSKSEKKKPASVKITTRTTFNDEDIINEFLKDLK